MRWGSIETVADLLLYQNTVLICCHSFVVLFTEFGNLNSKLSALQSEGGSFQCLVECELTLILLQCGINSGGDISGVGQETVLIDLSHFQKRVNSPHRS